MRTGVDDLITVLRDWNVTRVVTCPGTTEAAFLDATARTPDLETLLVTHESAAISICDGYARITGQPAVAYLHANVGLANGIGHLGAASLGYSPLLVLNGIKPTLLQSRGGFTTTPHLRELVRGVTKWDWQVLQPGQVADDVNRALNHACALPSGPVWVGLSQDVVEATSEAPLPDAERHRPSGGIRPSRDDLDRAAALLAGAERPLLVAGAEVARHGGTASLLALATRLGAPVVCEDRRGFEAAAFPSDDAKFVGAYHPELPVVRDADAVLFAGARCFVEFSVPDDPWVPTDAAVVHLHSDPAQVARIYGVDVGLIGDSAATLQDLDALVAEMSDGPRGDSSRVAAARELYETRRTQISVGPGEAPPLRLAEVMTTIAAETPPDAHVVFDAVTAGIPFLAAIPQRFPNQVIATASGSLGWGVGAAVGVALAAPGRPVVAVLGDGVLQFGLQALFTAVRTQVPVTYVVVNNGSYAAVAVGLQAFDGPAFRAGKRPGVDISGPDYARIAAGFGLEAVRVTDRSGLREALAGARSASAGPRLVEVMVDPKEVVD